MDINIMSNENFKDYKIRLCKNKDIYNLSWNMVADLLNSVSGNNFNESTYRKWWKCIIVENIKSNIFSTWY